MGRINNSMKKGNFTNRYYVSMIACLIAVLTLSLALTGCGEVELKDFIKAMTEEYKKEDIIYVRGDGNNDNPGTKGEPKRDIWAAIEYFVENNKSGEVHVAEGLYEVNFSENIYIQMAEGVSMYGGFDPDFGTRNPELYVSDIQDISSTGGETLEPNRAIECGSGITNTTVIDGFTINGGGGVYSSAICCKNSSLTIANNRINGGNGSVRSFGIANLNNSNPVIFENQEINGGSSASVSIGIWNYNESSSLIQYNFIIGGSGPRTGGIVNESNSEPVINGNTIHGGTAVVQSNGIQNLTSSPAIRNNTIFGGTGVSSSFGIMCFFEGTSQIQNNTIDGGTAGGTSQGIYLGSLDTPSGSTPKIQNNIIFVSSGTTRYCIHEDSNNGAHAQVIENNDLWNSGATTLYRDYTGNTYSDDIIIINGLAWADANESADPVFNNIYGDDMLPDTMEDNDWHLTSGSPVRYSARDLSSEFTTDKDDVTRTGNGAIGWSMGAYERD